MKKQLLNLLLVFVCFFSNAQEEDAWVFFTDKENVQASIENPISILTQRALDRKQRHNISIDERDVPVNENYIDQIKATEGLTVFAKSKWFNCIYVRGIQETIEDLTDLDFVSEIQFADRNLNGSRQAEVQQHKFELENTTIDFEYGNTFNQVDMINADALHQANYTGEGLFVAVMDSGFPNVDTIGAFQRLRDNNDLSAFSYDFVDRNPNVHAFTGNSHGTRVLSDMAGFIQDEFVGTAPDAMYVLFRTEDVASEMPVEESYWVEAAERADSLGVDVINTSLGYKGYDNPNYSYTSEDLDGETAFITRGSNIAFDKGMLLITSAGNSGASGVGAPADSPKVFSIGAVDAAGDYASFSSQGSNNQPTQKPDIVAQGSGSVVIDQNNNIVSNNGTSFSSPILAGAITSLWQAIPNRTNSELKEYVRATGSQFTNPDNFLGYGIPDFGEALGDALSIEEQENQEFSIFPNPVQNDLKIRFPFEVDQVSIQIHDILGKLVLKQTMDVGVSKLDLRALSSGMYLLKLESTKANNTFKLIKR